MIQQFNPLQASSEFLEKVLVNNRTVAEKMPYLLAAIFAAVGVMAVLFLYAAPRLRLDRDASRSRLPRPGRVASVLLVAGATLALVATPATRAQAAASAAPAHGLQISVDLEYKTVNAGDEVEFNTVVTNAGATASPPMNVAMNIVKTGKGEPVDPEDWSPERTQQVASPASG